ncbi:MULTISPECIES: type II toxin-antitoxin system VapC family toxin [unclassified Meiothermus]|uniref:type II toxin-antitoxin system VapC family toxin n=1 Tax=unclassified Meiothermus TaxID=370471 RepID=UPI000D7C73DE|nr:MULTISPECIES: PIN domain-containing protein [unclassified Meiothermus]PZA07011.1 VapC toxin family PIN domain ribonuclease [Meiothermus sp. Pnk-1]RYM35287.1 PIN domain-containing protein [Meiothermus sp. PNK-Is4]
MTLVDTSALYALLDQDDGNHASARETWERLLGEDEPLVTHLYVGVEATALAQRRLGLEAVRALEELLGVVSLHPVSLTLHQQALAALLGTGRREVSLVDWVSFLFMREHGLWRAFAFDRRFAEQGNTNPLVGHPNPTLTLPC